MRTWTSDIIRAAKKKRRRTFSTGSGAKSRNGACGPWLRCEALVTGGAQQNAAVPLLWL
jgi:hypothetical protein